jgi:steroid Delta-isomerase
MADCVADRRRNLMQSPLELAETSLALTKARDRSGWLALFEDDAVIQDPVGPSPSDPSGQGYRGIDAIAKFHDEVVSQTETFDYTIERSYTGGDEVAVVVNFQIVVAGNTMDMDLVNIYKRSVNGKLASLRSFWDGSRQGKS